MNFTWIKSWTLNKRLWKQTLTKILGVYSNQVYANWIVISRSSLLLYCDDKHWLAESNLGRNALFGLKVASNHQGKPRQKPWERNWSKKLRGAILIVTEILFQLHLLYSSAPHARKHREEWILLHQSIIKTMSHRHAHSSFNGGNSSVDDPSPWVCQVDTQNSLGLSLGDKIICLRH